jgi:predicted nucleotidyltransferase
MTYSFSAFSLQKESMFSYFEKLQKIADLFSISELYVFGSRADEVASCVSGRAARTEHPDADIDVGVYTILGKRLSVKEKVQLTIELEDLFQVPRVDLVVISEAPLFLGLEVIKGKLLYCKDPDKQAEHELLIMRQAGDVAYYENERRQDILEERQG